jgi:predicted nucleic acid-binding Zn ribbon protein
VTTWRSFGPGPAARDPRRVSELLDGVTRSLGAPRADLLSVVFSHWEEVVGPDIAAHASPRSLRDGVLVVVADQPAWAAQLRYLTADLLARIEAETSSPDVREIHIRVATPDGSGRAKFGGRRTRRETP